MSGRRGSGAHKLPDHFFRDAPLKPAPDPPPPLFVGDLVRFTGIFLKNTGQHVGPAGGQIFEVIPCEEGGRGDPRGPCNQCQDGLWVLVRDRSAGRYCRSSTHAIEAPAQVDAETRHIAVANVCRCERIDPRNCP